MNQLIEQIEIKYLYSVLASIIGYTMLYSYAPTKLKFYEFLRNIITVCVVGAVALAVAESYYPANSDMLNIAIIPFVAGFIMPNSIAAMAKILQFFAKDPATGIGLIAKVIAVVKGVVPPSNGDNKKDDSGGNE